MLVQIIASLLLAFGIFVLWNLFEAKKSDKDAFILLLISLALIITGGWLLYIATPPFGFLTRKIIGIILTLIGGFLVFVFPGYSLYQLKSYTNAGILIGLFILIIGVYLLVF